MSDDMVITRIPARSTKHEKITLATSASFNTAPDGSTEVRQSGFEDQCRMCHTPWPCLPAQLATTTQALSEATQRAVDAERERDAAQEWVVKWRDAAERYADQTTALSEARARNAALVEALYAPYPKETEDGRTCVICGAWGPRGREHEFNPRCAVNRALLRQPEARGEGLMPHPNRWRCQCGADLGTVKG